MTTAYTSLLGLALPVTGELSGTWGDTVNTAITSLLDSAVAGTTSITVDADITLTTTTGATNEARQAIILWNPASGTVTRNITAPAQSKLYTVINASGGTQSIVIRGAGPTTGVTIAKGESAQVAWNGSDFVKVGSSGGAVTFTNLTVTGNTILGDAAADTLTVNATSTFAAPVSFQGLVNLPSTGRSAAAALTPTNPAFLYGVASTYTDTTSSGTLAPVATFYSLARPTLATSNVTTYTNAATLYIANAPAAGGSATITNPYALYVAAGAAFFGGGISGSTVINDGTANGVAYLNGSKVLTTGTALVFDGTRLTVNGGATSEVLRLNSNADTYLAFQRGGAGTAYVQSAASAMYVWNQETTPMLFGVNNAEQMRLTSTGLGIGQTSPAFKLDVKASGTFNVARFSGQGGSVSTYIYTDSAYWYFGDSTGFSGNGFTGHAINNTLGLQTAGTERVFVGATGLVGIGTSSPSYALEVAIGTSGQQSIANFRTGSATVANNAGVQIFGTASATATSRTVQVVWDADAANASGTDYFVIEKRGSSGDVNLSQFSNAAMTFATNATERMRLDSTGRLSVGNSFAMSNSVTAFGVNTILDSFAQLSAVTTDSQAVNVGGQVTLGGKYRNVGGSADYCGFGAVAGRKENSTDGNYAGYLQFIVSNMPSGMIERARITSAGDFLIGTTSSLYSASGRGVLEINGASSAWTVWESAGTARAYLQASASFTEFGTLTSTSLNFFTNNVTRGGFSASGNFGVGTTSGNYRLNVVTSSGSGVQVTTAGATRGLPTQDWYDSNNGTEAILACSNGQVDFGAYSTHPLVFYTNNGERARIASGGAFQILSTSLSGSFSDGTPRFYVTPTGASSAYLWHTTQSADANFYMHRVGATGNYIYFGYDSSATGQISTNGSTVSYTSFSDYRAKKDVQAMTGGLEKVQRLRPVTYRWKSSGLEGQGFLAHELQEVCPEAVVGEKDAVNAQGEPIYQGIDTRFLVATLTAAIQEQQVIINQLKARLDAANL